MARQCERKHNYFVLGLIRLQVQEAYACIIELRLINTFLHTIPNSCMNGVTVVCACMHIYTWCSKSLKGLHYCEVMKVGGLTFVMSVTKPQCNYSITVGAWKGAKRCSLQW